MIRYLDELPSRADLVVVGAGIVGAATAFFSSRAGFDTLVLEARPAVATLTTPASTGAFRLQFDNRDEWELVRESVDIFERFAEVTGQDRHLPGIERNGYLFCTTEPERAAAQARLVARQHAWGQGDIELLDGREVRERFPYIAPEVVSARFRAGDGFLDPVEAARGFLAGSGAAVVTGCTVDRIVATDGAVAGVETRRGRVQARRVVVAAGPFSSRLLDTVAAGLVPLAIIDRQKVVVPDLAEVPPGAPLTIDDDTGTHWRPYRGGAAVLFTDPAAPETVAKQEVPPDAAQAMSLLDPSSPRSAARIAPFWRDVWDRRPQWTAVTGQYVVTPDHRAFIGETALPGLFVNTGYSGHGIMGSPAGSRLLVDVMLGEAATNPFALDRDLEERDRERDVL